MWMWIWRMKVQLVTKFNSESILSLGPWLWFQIRTLLCSWGRPFKLTAGFEFEFESELITQTRVHISRREVNHREKIYKSWYSWLCAVCGTRSRQTVPAFLQLTFVLCVSIGIESSIDKDLHVAILNSFQNGLFELDLMHNLNLGLISYLDQQLIVYFESDLQLRTSDWVWFEFDVAFKTEAKIECKFRFGLSWRQFARNNPASTNLEILCKGGRSKISGRDGVQEDKGEAEARQSQSG